MVFGVAFGVWKFFVFVVVVVVFFGGGTGSCFFVFCVCSVWCFPVSGDQRFTLVGSCFLLLLCFWGLLSFSEKTFVTFPGVVAI